MSNKKINWVQDLHAKVAEFNAKPFVWGTHDCCSFAADCVLAMTGNDAFKDYRGGYKTQFGANKRLKRLGGLEAATTKLLGEPLNNVAFAQRGDVICFAGPLGDTAGICMGATISAAGLDGLAQVPMNQAYKAWRV